MSTLMTYSRPLSRQVADLKLQAGCLGLQARFPPATPSFGKTDQTSCFCGTCIYLGLRSTADIIQMLRVPGVLTSNVRSHTGIMTRQRLPENCYIQKSQRQATDWKGQEVTGWVTEFHLFNEDTFLHIDCIFILSKPGELMEITVGGKLTSSPLGNISITHMHICSWHFWEEMGNHSVNHFLMSKNFSYDNTLNHPVGQQIVVVKSQAFECNKAGSRPRPCPFLLLYQIYCASSGHVSCYYYSWRSKMTKSHCGFS